MPGPNYWLEFSDLLPRTWTRIGYPVPIPGGYVFAVTARVGLRRFAFINRYDTAAHALSPVLDATGRALTFLNSTEARAALPVIAHRIESEDD